MLKIRQLYHTNSFILPELPNINLKPFDQSEIPKMPSNEIEQIHQHPETYSLAYYQNYEGIIGAQNMYPILLDTSPQRLVVCSKDSAIVFGIEVNHSQIVNKPNDRGAIKLQKMLKIQLPGVPTAVKIAHDFVYFGFYSGKIECYSLLRKSFTGSSEDFLFPVFQMELISETDLIGIDSAGNIKNLTFNHKTFMDRIIKTMVSCKEISVIYRNKKREKIKKMFKNLISSKQISSNETEPNSSENFGMGCQGFPYFHNYFSLIPEEVFEKHYQGQYKPLAVYRKKSLSIIMLNSDYGMESEILLMEDLEEIGIMEFGIGGFEQSNNTHILLVVSTGNKLIYFRAIKVEETYDWVQVSTCTFDGVIKDGKFISNNLLVILTQNGVQLCVVNEKPNLVEKINFDKFSYIDFFNEEEDLNFDKKLLDKSILRGMCGESVLFCLEGKRLLVGRLSAWNQFLTFFVDQSRWNDAMSCALMIYQGQIKKLAGINENQHERNQEMKEFFQKITLTYIAFEIKREHFTIENMLTQVIHFMIKTQSCFYLFTTIYEAIEKFNFLNEFLSCLEPYIDSGSINFMTEPVLEKVLQYYTTIKKAKQLEVLIKNFDLEMMEKSMLLTICLRYGLYESLIHICTHSVDFITPVIKLCGIRVNQKEKANEQLVEIIFWYLGECLAGHFTEFGNHKAYIEMLAQLINFIFIPNSLQMLLEASPLHLFRVLNLFFEPKILQYMLENEDRFFIKDNQHFSEHIFQEGSLAEFAIYEKMLMTIVHVVNKIELNHQECQFNLYIFLTYIILKNQLPFKSDYKLSCALFLIEHPHLFHHSEELSENDEIQINAYLMRIMDSIFRSVSEANQPQVKEKLLYELESKMALSNAKLFMESKCYVLNQRGKHDQIMTVFLRMDNKLMRKKVFNYLEKNIPEFEQLVQELINNLPSLIRIDQQRTMNLLVSLPASNYCETIIQSLNEFSDQQLFYIEKILPKSPFQQKLLLFHLQIVFKHKRLELEKYIQNMDYPLEEAYKLCEESKNKVGMSYILIKGGRNMEGVTMLAEIFLDSCDDVFKLLAQRKEVPVQKKERMFSQLGKVIQTCEKDRDKSEEIWFKIVEKIFKHLQIQHIDSSTSIPQPIKQILNEILERILQAMFEEASVDFFINVFDSKLKNLPFRVFIRAFNLVNHRITTEYTLNVMEKDMLKEEEIGRIKLYLNSLRRGNSCGLMCQHCTSDAKMAKHLISYHCGHIFHRECLQKLGKPCYLCEGEVKLAIQKISQVEILKGIETDDKPKEMRISKLKSFDAMVELHEQTHFWS